MLLEGDTFFWIVCPVQQKLAKKFSGLFTRQLTVETRQGDAEGLQGAHGVPVIHGEDVVCHPPELHDDVVRIAVVNNLYSKLQNFFFAVKARAFVADDYLQPCLMFLGKVIILFQPRTNPI
jgi:hypothetical protein